MATTLVGNRFAAARMPLLAALVLAMLSRAAEAANDVAGDLILFNDNGAWSWFEDERVIVDVAAGKLLVSSVGNAAGLGGTARHGDIEVASLNLASGAVTRFTLSDNLEADDHDSAALWQRPDGRYLAVYAKHNSDNFTRWRVTTNPSDASSWSAEQTFNNNAGATYSNLHFLPADNGGAGRLYNFLRSVGFDPNILVSADNGNTWSYGGRLLAEGTNSDRPYARYFSNGDRVDVMVTNRHPRDFDNSIFHGYIKDGKLYNSIGAVLDDNLFDATARAPADLTPVFTTGTQFAGVTMRRGWTVDVAIDDAGQPYGVFQARANDLDTDHRFFYGRFNGTTWDVHEVAKAGGFLYASEMDYTGLAAVDPHDPNRLFISTKIDPRTQATMPHYEIFEGVTTSGGASWTWKPITFASTIDNLRPIVPAWNDDHTALLWMRGKYNTYTNYNLEIVGLTEIKPITASVDGDLDHDGDVDTDDAAAYLSGLHVNLAGLSFEEAFALGDLTGDRSNIFSDFVLFQAAYDAANGAGAFAKVAKVPEPGGAAMLAAIGTLGAWLRANGPGAD